MIFAAMALRMESVFMKILKSALLTAILASLSASAYCAGALPFNLITRAQWGAQWVDPASYSYSAPVKFTLHHTALAYPANLEAAKAEMRALQQSVMSWGIDTAYHYVISPQGDVFQGIPDDRLGSHALNDNYNNIGICFMGNYMNDTLTPQSLDAFVNLVKHLKAKYPAIQQRAAYQNDSNPRNRVYIDHRETYATLCPGDKLVALHNELFARIFKGGSATQPPTPPQPPETGLPFNLVTRSQWGAQWVDPGSYVNSAPVKFTLHHTAGGFPANLEAAKDTMRKIQQEVMSWGTDTAYHYIISPQGDVFQGIPDDKLGSHAQNDNYNNIGICFMGNYMNETPTPQSLDAFVKLVKHLKSKYPAIQERSAHQNESDPAKRAFILHRETYNTLCPGDKLAALQNELFTRIFARESAAAAAPIQYTSHTILPGVIQPTGATGSAYLDLLQSVITSK